MRKKKEIKEVWKAIKKAAKLAPKWAELEPPRVLKKNGFQN